MVEEKEIKKDLKELKKHALAILQYGSTVDQTSHQKSDTDICIIAGKKDIKELFNQLLQNKATQKYDIKIFEQLPLKIKASVIENHKTLWTRDDTELTLYLHRYQRIWSDQKQSLRKLGIEIYA